MKFSDIDLLSSRPTNFIFGRTSKKKNCGTIFTIIIIVLSSIAAYFLIIKYISENKYSISYTNYKNDQENIPSLKNPGCWKKNVEFKYHLEKYNYSSKKYETFTSENRFRFKLLNRTNNSFIEQNSKKIIPIEYFDYDIVYECQDSQCQIEEDLNLKNLLIRIDFTIKEIEYQSVNPIKNRDYYFRVLLSKTFERTIYYFKRVLFQDISMFKDTNYSILSPTSYHESTPYYDYNHKSIRISGKDYKKIGNVRFEIEGKGLSSWVHYQRREKFIGNLISDICSIINAIYVVINFCYLNLFSYFYDNYRVMDYILKKGEKMKRHIDLSNRPNSSTNRQNSLIEHENQDDNINLDIAQQHHEKSNSEIEKQKEVKFKDIVFSSLYNCFCSCECCKLPSCCSRSKEQILIDKYNETLAEFYSIENIIYNQILIENLFKDYIWNDERLKDINENEKIIRLNNTIKQNSIEND